MTAATLTLTDFILERIAEDGAVLDCGVNAHDGATVSGLTSASCGCDFRAKREWQAKLRIVANAMACADQAIEQVSPTQKTIAECMAETAFDAVKTLGLIYADHPDFREEWRP